MLCCGGGGGSAEEITEEERRADAELKKAQQQADQASQKVRMPPQPASAQLTRCAAISFACRPPDCLICA